MLLLTSLALGAEIWTGDIRIPGMPMTITATLEEGSGTIDIPAQGIAGMKLHDVDIDGVVAFTLKPPGAPPAAWAVFSTKRDGDVATGTMKQSGQSFPVELKRVEDASQAGPKRPQTPKPPFPYDSEDVTWRSGAIPVAGTLTRPKGKGPFPAVLLITGSGAQDRDETIFGHKPFAVIADRLTRDGIAVLRADDRGVGGTGGVLKDATAKVLVSDVRAGVAWLRQRDDIDAKRVGVIGHSEGGMTGPMAAAEDDGIAFVVMLAGTGIPSREILLAQGEAMYRANGAMGADLDELLRVHAAALDAKKGPERKAAVAALVHAQFGLQGLPPTPGAIEAGLAQFDTPWFESFLTIDPATYLAEVKVPVLALGGDLDFQVPTKTNVPAIRAALANNPDATVEELPGLNHLFQEAKTGMLDEYGVIEQTIAPSVLDRVSAWVVDHTK